MNFVHYFNSYRIETSAKQADMPSITGYCGCHDSTRDYKGN